MYNKLLNTAKQTLETVTEAVNGLPAPQVTVLLTASHRIYTAVNDVDGAICNTLKQHNDTKVEAMLTMWKDGCVDVASLPFRKALTETDKHNLQTAVVLCSEDGYHTKVLSATLP